MGKDGGRGGMLCFVRVAGIVIYVILMSCKQGLMRWGSRRGFSFCREVE